MRRAILLIATIATTLSIVAIAASIKDEKGPHRTRQRTRHGRGLDIKDEAHQVTRLREPAHAERTPGVLLADEASAVVVGRAPSCGGCQRRESVLAKTMRLSTYSRTFETLGPLKSSILGVLIALTLGWCARRFLEKETLLTLVYALLYLTSSPTAILVNKILMKDIGFGYPVLVSALGQGATSIVAAIAVRMGYVDTRAGRQVEPTSLIYLGGASALALVLGQYPYLYLTVAFIQMLKAFSPAYMVIISVCRGVEYPSRREIACIGGLCVFTAIASAGEINFNVVGVMFMAAASISDALRLVLAQELLKNQNMQPMETLYFISPICLLWMVPAAIFTELPGALRSNSLALMRVYPFTFLASGLAGCFVNLTSFLLTKRTSAMTLKTLTMARNGGLVIVSALVMGEQISNLEAFGYTGLLICFALYTWLQATEKQATEEPPSAADKSMHAEKGLLTEEGSEGDDEDRAATPLHKVAPR